MLEINLTDDEIAETPKKVWKKIVKEQTIHVAFTNLVEENRTKEKTKHIVFEELKMSTYLSENKNTSISKIIFSVR